MRRSAVTTSPSQSALLRRGGRGRRFGWPAAPASRQRHRQLSDYRTQLRTFDSRFSAVAPPVLKLSLLLRGASAGWGNRRVAAAAAPLHRGPPGSCAAVPRARSPAGRAPQCPIRLGLRESSRARSTQCVERPPETARVRVARACRCCTVPDGPPRRRVPHHLCPRDARVAIKAPASAAAGGGPAPRRRATTSHRTCARRKERHGPTRQPTSCLD